MTDSLSNQQEFDPRHNAHALAHEIQRRAEGKGYDPHAATELGELIYQRMTTPKGKPK